MSTELKLITTSTIFQDWRSSAPAASSFNSSIRLTIFSLSASIQAARSDYFPGYGTSAQAAHDLSLGLDEPAPEAAFLMIFYTRIRFLLPSVFLADRGRGRSCPQLSCAEFILIQIPLYLNKRLSHLFSVSCGEAAKKKGNIQFCWTFPQAADPCFDPARHPKYTPHRIRFFKSAHNPNRADRFDRTICNPKQMKQSANFNVLYGLCRSSRPCGPSPAALHGYDSTYFPPNY